MSRVRIRTGALYQVEASGADPGEKGPTLWTFEAPDLFHFQLEPGDILLALEGHSRGGLFLHSRTGAIGWVALPRLEPGSSRPFRPWLREVKG